VTSEWVTSEWVTSEWVTSEWGREANFLTVFHSPAAHSPVKRALGRSVAGHLQPEANEGKPEGAVAGVPGMQPVQSAGLPDRARISSCAPTRTAPKPPLTCCGHPQQPRHQARMPISTPSHAVAVEGSPNGPPCAALVAAAGWLARRASLPNAPPSSSAYPLQPGRFPARSSPGARSRSSPIRSSDSETYRLSGLSAVRLATQRLSDLHDQIEVHAVAGDGNAVKIHQNRQADPTARYRSLVVIDGDSRQVEDHARGIFRLPGQQPEAEVFNQIRANLVVNVALLTVSLQLAPEKQTAVMNTLDSVASTNRDPHVLFNQVGVQLGFTSEEIVKGAFVSMWLRGCLEAFKTLVTRVRSEMEGYRGDQGRGGNRAEYLG